MSDRETLLELLATLRDEHDDAAHQQAYQLGGWPVNAFQYIRDYYQVPACIGRRVTVNGRQGVIVADRGHYIGVNFDDEGPSVVHNCHPTWKVVYGDIGMVRRLSRSQRRYQRYLNVAECYTSFRAFLAAETAG